MLKKKSVFTTAESIIYAILLSLGLAVVLAFGLWWFSFEHVPQNFTGIFHSVDFLLFIMASYVVWYQITYELLTWVTAIFMKHPVLVPPSRGLKVATATAFVPGKEPYEVLEKALEAMTAVEYPHDTWVLDEGNDGMVKILCARYGAKHFSRHGIAKYNADSGHFKARTKAGNYNAWFDTHGAKYEIVAQHDVDFIPRKDFLMKTLGYFKDPKVAFVGAPQVYGNVTESWIARGAAEQAYGFYGTLQKGFFGLDMQLFIGANHVIRVAAHDSIGGYSGHIVEDHLTGMRLYANRWKSVYVPEALLVGEGPATWEAYFSQQLRWAYGLIDILFRHTPKIAPKMRPHHAFFYVLLQQYYFFGLAQAIGMLLVALYFVFGITSAEMTLLPLLILYPLFLVMQLIIFIWLQKFYIDPAQESGLHLAGKLLNIAAWPIYVLAFFSALAGKKLDYQVTPKGSAQPAEAPHVGTFLLHLIVGTISALTIAAYFITDHQAPQLLLWALLNVCFMYFFVLLTAWNRIRQRMSDSMHALERFFSRAMKEALFAASLGFALLLWTVATMSISISDTQRAAVSSAYESLGAGAAQGFSSIVKKAEEQVIIAAGGFSTL